MVNYATTLRLQKILGFKAIKLTLPLCSALDWRAKIHALVHLGIQRKIQFDQRKNEPETSHEIDLTVFGQMRKAHIGIS